MSEYGERANALFCTGYNCAQSTFATLCPLTGLEEKTALRLASGLGGGVARQREVCGAVLAISMAAGLLRGYDAADAYEEKIDTYAMIQQLCGDFKKIHGSIICRELLGLEKAEGTPVPSRRTEQYYHDRRCGEYCRTAADLLARWLEEHPAT